MLLGNMLGNMLMPELNVEPFIRRFSQAAAYNLCLNCHNSSEAWNICIVFGFVAFPESLKLHQNEKNSKTFIPHCHGDSDPTIPLQGDKMAFNFFYNKLDSEI